MDRPGAQRRRHAAALPRCLWRAPRCAFPAQGADQGRSAAGAAGLEPLPHGGRRPRRRREPSHARRRQDRRAHRRVERYRRHSQRHQSPGGELVAHAPRRRYRHGRLQHGVVAAARRGDRLHQGQADAGGRAPQYGERRRGAGGRRPVLPEHAAGGSGQSAAAGDAAPFRAARPPVPQPGQPPPPVDRRAHAGCRRRTHHRRPRGAYAALSPPDLCGAPDLHPLRQPDRVFAGSPAARQRGALPQAAAGHRPPGDRPALPGRSRRGWWPPLPHAACRKPAERFSRRRSPPSPAAGCRPGRSSRSRRRWR